MKVGPTWLAKTFELCFENLIKTFISAYWLRLASTSINSILHRWKHHLMSQSAYPSTRFLRRYDRKKQKSCQTSEPILAPCLRMPFLTCSGQPSEKFIRKADILVLTSYMYCTAHQYHMGPCVYGAQVCANSEKL